MFDYLIGTDENPNDFAKALAITDQQKFHDAIIDALMEMEENSIDEYMSDDYISMGHD